MATRGQGVDWSRIERPSALECWTWTGRLTNSGYGKYCGTVAHLVVYRRLIGPTPPGLQADHLCHDLALCVGGDACPHRTCVNPAHLRWVTPSHNLSPQRRNRWGRLPGEVGLDTCKRDHEFTEENTAWNLSRGVKVRRCKACARETARQWQARNRGADPGEFAPRVGNGPRKRPPLRTHCRVGHEYTPENTYHRPDGKGRECKRCSGRV